MKRQVLLSSTILMGIALCASSVHAAHQRPCNSISSAELDSLANYIQRKFHLQTRVLAAEEPSTFAEQLCYTKLRFQTTDKQALDLTLYLTPDRQFLVKELLDPKLDPWAEESKEKALLLRKITDGTNTFLGSDKAQVTLTIFSDFQCPYCRKEALVLKEEGFFTDKNIRVVFRYLPLPMHNWSDAGANAAACAADQSRSSFWRLHDYLFQNQAELRMETLNSQLVSQSGTIGVDRDKFQSCLNSRSFAKTIQRDIALAHSLNVTSTPTIFVNTVRVDGAVPSEQLWTIIKQVISASSSQSIE